MTELTYDLRKHLNDFQKICIKFNNYDRSNKELTSVLNDLKQTNELLKANDKKYIEQIKTLRQICNEQENSIAKLYKHERQNEILSQENVNLKEKLIDMESKYKMKFEEKEREFKKRENELNEKIEVLQASFDLEMFEKNNENRNVKLNCEEQIKKALEKEQQFKDEIFKLNTELSSNTGVLQKKILELEQKLKTSEREKSVFNISQGNFISANNILKHNPNNLINNNTKKLSQNIEYNTAKKFQFHKTNRGEKIEKKLLSESFDPFEMYKQANSSPCDDTIEVNSEHSSNSIQEVVELKQLENSNITVVNNNLNNQENKKTKIKKRRLFNPKDMDYLS